MSTTLGSRTRRAATCSARRIRMPAVGRIDTRRALAAPGVLYRFVWRDLRLPCLAL